MYYWGEPLVNRGPESGVPKKSPFVRANFSVVVLSSSSRRVKEQINHFLGMGLPYKHCTRIWFATKVTYYKLEISFSSMAIHYSSFKEEFHLFHGKGPLLSTGPKGGLLLRLLFVLQKLLTVVSAEHFRLPCIFIWVSPPWNK